MPSLNKSYRVIELKLALDEQGQPTDVAHILREIDPVSLVPVASAGMTAPVTMTVTLPFAQRQPVGTIVDSTLTPRP